MTHGLLLRICAAIAAVTAMPGPAHADSVMEWMGILSAATDARYRESGDLVLSTHIDGQVALAMFEAANAVDHRYRSFLNVAPTVRPASGDAAVITAAHDVLASSYPEQAGTLQESYDDAMIAIPEGEAKRAGVEVGHAAATAALAAGGKDAGFQVDSYRPAAEVGVWVPTGLPTLPTSYLAYRPWFLKGVTELRPGPPPSLASRAYVAAFEETKSEGSKQSSLRTPEQTQAAIFWIGNNEPALLSQITDRPGRTLVQNAHFYALVTLAHDDENTALTDAKMHYMAWRPITAIRNADKDPSPETQRDPSWESLIQTPTHPEYPCGHCMHNAMLMAIISAEPGVDPDQPLTFTAVHMPHVALSMTPAEAAKNCSSARIWGGVHFRFSTEAGEAMGRRMAQVAMADFAPPLK